MEDTNDVLVNERDNNPFVVLEEPVGFIALVLEVMFSVLEVVE